jgi:hypothetical protein
MRADQDGVMPHPHGKFVLVLTIWTERLAHLSIYQPFKMGDAIRLLTVQSQHDPLGRS